MRDTDNSSIQLSLPGKLAVLLSGALISFAMGGLIPILPVLADHFNRSPNAAFLVRGLISVVGLSILIGAPLIGMLADTFGRRRILLSAICIYGVTGTAAVVLDNIYLLLVSRFLFGLSTAAIGALTLTVVAKVAHGATRDRWMGYINTVISLSGLLLLPLAGFLGKQGWQWPFLIHALAFPIWLMALIGLPPEKSTDHGSSRQKASAPPMPWRFVLTVGTCGVLLTTYLMFAPFHLREIGIREPELISTAMLPATVLSALAAFFYGTLRKRLSLDSVFVLTFALSCLGHFVIAFGQSYMVVVIGQSFLGLCSGLLAPNVYALGAVTGTDEHRAFIMGLVKGGLYAGLLVGQLISEPIAKHYSAGTALALLGSFAAALALFHGWRQLRARLARAAA